MFKKIIIFLIFFYFKIQSTGIVICTASDELYFDPLINLIGSIHKVNFDDLQEISVYNLGLTKKQIEQINLMEKVKLYEVDIVHPDLLKPMIIDIHGRSARGWYAWKPVIIKQALDNFPTVLYLDSGNTVLQPLNNIFKHIQENDYFFLSGSPHLVRDWTTKGVIDYFKLNSQERNFILKDEAKSISANIIGLTRKLYDNLILPMYNHAKEFFLFVDDGTGPGGFGRCRHDQTLFNMYVYLLKLKLNNQGYSTLKFDNKKTIFHTHYESYLINGRSTIYQSRWQYAKNEKNIPYFSQFIRYKNNTNNKETVNAKIH